MPLTYAADLTSCDWDDIKLEKFAARLDAKMSDAIARVEASPVWRAVMSPETPPNLLRAIMREIYLEISSYQPVSTEAIIAIIGRMPKTEPKMIRTMLLHQVDEADHGEMALRDYIALGGDEQFARARRRSPAALVFDGVWWELFRSESPFTYLGAMYPFEGMTPTFCERVQEVLERRGLSPDALGFIVFHAKEDIAHRNLIRTLIKDVAGRFPGAAEAIEYGMACFLQVFPLPIWMAAYDRAIAECGS